MARLLTSLRRVKMRREARSASHSGNKNSLDLLRASLCRSINLCDIRECPMRDELAARAGERAATSARRPKMAVVFEARPFAAAEIDALIGRAVQDGISFIGIVSRFDRNTSLPLHRLLQATDVPVHFFPGSLHAYLLRSLRESSKIQVLGCGSDPRGELLAHLEKTGQFDRQPTTDRQAVA
jgi:hypothetical protein